ncbi:MAG: hypothetical protein JXP34_21490 [Planctomycetes bacterium]|nr:hypothetical protein [Planctomycetota bacterium]
MERCRGGLAAAAVLNAFALFAAPEIEREDTLWTVQLQDFFGEKKPLNVYVVGRGGRWVAGLCTATDPTRGKAVWNTAMMPADPIEFVPSPGKLGGRVTITLVPDPWVPKDRKVRIVRAAIDGTLGAPEGKQTLGTLSGQWEARIDGTEAELAGAGLRPSASGLLGGGVRPAPRTDLSDASYDLMLYDLIPGRTDENYHRRRGLSLGVKDGKVVSARLSQIDIRHNAYDHEILETPSDWRVEPDAFGGSAAFEAMTLDGLPAEFRIVIEGTRVHDFVAGTYRGTCAIEGGSARGADPIRGYFRGNVRAGAFVAAGAKDDRPWFIPVAGFEAPAPGEHPRLFFRKTDAAELRRRAQTPDGRRIIARLRQLLNGSDGMSMPVLYNPAKQAYEKNGFKAAAGAYSISHAAGFGFLHQVTGETIYADLARRCVEKALAGQRDFDDRYAWVAPGGELRAGPSIGWTAVAYDLCYDAWDEDFRRRMALAIQDYADVKGGEWNEPEGITLRKLVLQPRQGPRSNHFGAVVGGAGLAVLAIRGDPGTDRERLDLYLRVLEKQVVRHLSAGWGDGGYYSEGWGASTVGTQGGFLCFLQALKIAAGHDYLNVERPNASSITMVPRCLMLIGPPAVLPYRSNMGPTYGSAEFHRERDGFSHGGHFVEGFGAIADRFKPALLWTYNHVVEPDEGRREFDTCSLYPHRPMLALINWPTFSGIAERDPAEVMPRASADHLYDYFVFRNRWRDARDIVTTVLIRQPDGTKPREVMVWGLGLRLRLNEPERNAPVTHFRAAKDGSGEVAAGRFALAVDYSGASGADALVVTAGSEVRGFDPAPANARFTVVRADSTAFNVLTLSATGDHPEPKAAAGRLIVGDQRVILDGGKLRLERFAE